MMNLRTQFRGTVFPISRRSRRGDEADAMQFSRSRSQRGVALVVTLILLAVITTLAIAFLGITQRETVSVDSMGRTTDAEMAADSALERAKAEILAVYPFRNQGAANGSFTMGPDMFVSACCHNFDTNKIGDTPTAQQVIPYDRLDTQQRITNRYDSAPPVFVNTNKPGVAVDAQHPLDDRFYVDLNRNSMFEDTGHVPDTTDNSAGPGRFQYAVQAGNIVTNWRVGDPQWVGVLRNPRQSHGPNNPYIARQAFMVLPAGRSLDVNWVHNDARNFNNPALGESWYSRNEGVGGYEINLAAFLADVNTNAWNNPNAPYNATRYTLSPDLNYPPTFPPALPSRGTSFDDAWDVLSFRISGSKANMNNLYQVFNAQTLPQQARVDAVFMNDGIDTYALNPPLGTDADAPPRIWPGSDSLNRFHTPHDFLTAITTLSNRLSLVSRFGNSYDRYTYYRMLAQLGTDSAEDDDEGKINLNYVNIRSWNPSKPNFRYRASDLVSWTNSTGAFINDMGRPGPELFFLTTVTNLLGREPSAAFMVTNLVNGWPLMIPILTNGLMVSTNGTGSLYGGRVHHILQLAANIYDATTGSKRGEAFPYLPAIFRPHFVNYNGGVYINDYTLFDEPANTFLDPAAPNRWKDLESGGTITNPDDMVWGIPFIIGARKGFPAFSEVGVSTVAEAWRKLTFTRLELGKPITTNQDFSLKVWHNIQIEARNPYTTPIPRGMEIVADIRNTTQASNSVTRYPLTGLFTNAYRRVFRTNDWPGEEVTTGAKTYPNYVVTPAFQHMILDVRTNGTPEAGGFTNQWFVSLTNRLNFYIVDTNWNRIVDMVTLKPPSNHMNVAHLLYDVLDTPTLGLQDIWNPGRSGTQPVSIGVQAQIDVSRGVIGTSQSEWDSFADSDSKRDGATAFSAFMETNGPVDVKQAPFTPLRRMAQVDYFQVNDPLVHYTLEDLANYSGPGAGPFIGTLQGAATNRIDLPSKLGKGNDVSMTWNNGRLERSDPSSPALLDTTKRDPGLIRSDFWNFPSQPLPSVGWLGRVHRGTPWQTIYLKSRDAGNDWDTYAGPSRATEKTKLMRPQRDRELFDIFTTAPHPNAERGRLSINQTNLAAWSAVLAGTYAARPIPDPNEENLVTVTNEPIQPAALGGLMQNVARAVNANRTLYNSNAFTPVGQYRGAGQILSTPELSERSPLLNADPALFDPNDPHGAASIYDEDYERIPQQILSLLKVGEPRFVIYSWGQSLKPARQGVQLDNNGRVDLTKPLSGPSITVDGSDRVVNNYQITGETATKAVVRVVFPEQPGGGPDYRRPKLVVESFNVINVE